MRKGKGVLLQLGTLGLLGAAVILTLFLPQLMDAWKAKPLLELSVISRESDGALLSNTRLGMEQAADELGAELRFLTLSAANAEEEQENLLQREADGGADALVVSSAGPDRLAARLRTRGIPCPVVAVESPVEGAFSSVTPDNLAIGRELASAAREDWTGGTVLLLETGRTGSAASVRLAAARAVLEEAGIPVRCCTMQAAVLARDLEGLLRETGAVQIMAFEPSATEQAAEGKESAGLLQPLYGVGATANVTAGLERGTISATAAWSEFAAGYLAVEAAVQAVRERAPVDETLPFFLVRGEDIYEPKNQKLLFPVA